MVLPSMLICPLFIRFAYLPIAAPKSDGEFSMSVYCFKLSKPWTTSCVFPSRSGTHIDTTRPPKLVMSTSMPLEFLSWNNFTGMLFTTESKAAVFNPEAVVCESCVEEQADSAIAAVAVVNKNSFRLFIVSVVCGYKFTAYKVTKNIILNQVNCFLFIKNIIIILRD